MELNNTRTINELVSAIAYVLDAMNEGANLYHSWRVGIFASEFANKILPEERKNIFYASLLHDIGYLALPKHIMHYLSVEESPEKDPAISTHPIIGAEIISQIPNLSTAAKYILNHHEWHNGRGYPLGRQRDEIPTGAQIILLADQIDILIRDKSIRRAGDIKKAAAAWPDERISSGIIEATLPVLSKGTFLQKAINKKTITALFNSVRKDTGRIKMPSNLDAIGITCEIFSLLIDIKHPPMIGHSKRVSLYSLLISLAMDLPHDEITKVKWAAFLHDVGKLGITRSLINKPGKFTLNEREKMKQDTLFTRGLIETITDFKDIAFIASSNHERYDGKGYPSGLKGGHIPLPARIISAADAFDSMTSNRPYRKAITIEDACKELENNAGTQFDPKVVKEALPVLRNLAIRAR
jgi:HD-GYP domain-containing protein (c-di-GMP phosphodiesterase class II)